jgi:hypothetical protein
MHTIDPHTPSFGSSHDPVLHGVASGLAELFPLVDHPAGLADELQEKPASLSDVTSEGET